MACERSTRLLQSAVDVIGNTPLVELHRLVRNSRAEGHLLAKLEFLNPGHSKKDRIAKQIIEDAELNGELKPGQEVIEMTSGNTGTGLAIVCAAKGYKFVAVMSKGNSAERAKMMRALGAEVLLVDQAPGGKPGKVSGEDIKMIEDVTTRLVTERNAFRGDQFNRMANFRAHYLHTAEEILNQTKSLGKQIDLFCDFVGSGGGFAGCSAKLREHNPKIQCYVVEPAGAAILAGQVVSTPNHRIQGGGYSMNYQTLPMMQAAPAVDGFIQVTDEEAMAMCSRLAREEGLFVGFSSGANVFAALKLLGRSEHRGKTIVVTLNDSGMKYLSTDLWESIDDSTNASNVSAKL